MIEVTLKKVCKAEAGLALLLLLGTNTAASAQQKPSTEEPGVDMQ